MDEDSVRQVNSFTDVSNELTKIWESLDKDRLHDIDLHGHRITNAHPSIKDTDYVVRAELLQAIGGFPPQPTQVIRSGSSSVTDFEVASFGLAFNQNLVTGTNLCAPHICINAGTFVKWYAALKIACTGATAKFDIKLGGVSILSSVIEVPTGDITCITGTSFAIASITETQILTIDCTQIGSSAPGSGAVIKVKYRKT